MGDSFAHFYGSCLLDLSFTQSRPPSCATPSAPPFPSPSVFDNPGRVEWNSLLNQDINHMAMDSNFALEHLLFDPTIYGNNTGQLQLPDSGDIDDFWNSSQMFNIDPPLWDMAP
jgi:hypothetical protein